MTRTPLSRKSFDYVIVGAGSAGCVLANRLSADESTTVLLIEAGGKDDYFWLRVPLAIPFVLANPRVDWCYESEPEQHLDGRVIRLPRGKTLGGSSSINGMVYTRGNADDYDRWRDRGNAGWGWDEILPYFKRSEDYHGGANDAHGVGGELRVSDPGQRWEILDAYRDAAVESGLPPMADYNDGCAREGVGYVEMTIGGGVRWSASRGFLNPVMRRPNLQVTTKATVTRILFEGRRACGVSMVRDGVSEEVAARAEVIVCAGSYGSPQLLQLSGVGPGLLLQGLGIPVIGDLPGVGENLQDHWMVRNQHRVRNTLTLNNWIQNPVRKAMLGASYLLARRGPMTAPPLLLAAFARSDPAVAAPDIRLVVSVASYARVGGPMDRFPGITSSACVCRPTSRGHVRVTSRDPMAKPAIVNNYLASAEDCRIAIKGMRLVRRIVASPAMARFGPEAIQPAASTVSDDDLLAFARSVATTNFHPVGTCAMGSEPMAVVNDRLEVRGCESLRVVDASIMPTIVSDGTNAATIMIAEKAADLIRRPQRS